MATLAAAKPSENLSPCVGQPTVAPASNTGGISDKKSASILIDTLSLTGKLDNLPCPATCFTDDHRANWLSKRLGECLGLVMVGDHAGKSNGFQNSRKLGYADGRPCVSLGFVAWGGQSQRGSFQIYLTGECCEYLGGAGLISDLRNMAESLELRITRIDIAYDDYQGERDLNSAVECWKSGGFKFTHNPGINQVGNWTGNDKKGRTVYIGSRSSGKMLRVYEKGKQLGDPSSPWVRWELELKAKDRKIPLEALTRPHSYFKGAYPALRSFVASGAAEVVKTIKKKARIAVDTAKESIKAQYGRYIGLLRSLSKSDSELLDSLSRSGIPRSLIFPIPEKAELLIDADVVDVGVYRSDGLLF